MIYTEDQIQVKRQKAKQAGWSDAQIEQAVGELSAGGFVQKKGFLRNVGEALVNPLLDFGSLVGEAAVQGAGSLFNTADQSQADRLLEQQRAILQNEALSQEEKERQMAQLGQQIDRLSGGIQRRTQPAFMTSPKRRFAFEQISGDEGAGAFYGLRKGAGAASYLVPVGGGQAASALGRIGTAGALGAGAGALRTFGEDFTDVGDIVGGAFVGGATAGALQGAGEAVRAIRPGVSKGAGKASDALSKGAKRKRLNKVSIRKYGEGKFLDDLDDVGLGQFNDPEDLAEQARITIQQNMDELNAGIGGINKKFDRTTILKMLDDEIAKRPAADARKPFEAVRDKILKDTTGRWIDPADYIQLRRNYGGLGKWKLGGEISTGQAGAYEQVYKVMNDEIETKLAAKGFETFRQNNKAVTTAIKALDVADEALRKVSAEPLNLYDYIVGAGAFTVDPLAAVGTIGVRRGLTSPRGMDILSGGFGRVADATRGATQTGGLGAGILPKAASSLFAQSRSRPGGGGTGMTIEELEQLQQQQQFGQPQVARQPQFQQAVPQQGFVGSGANYLNRSQIPVQPQQQGFNARLIQTLGGQAGGQQAEPQKLTKDMANAQSGLRALQTLGQSIYQGGDVNRGSLLAQSLPFQAFSPNAQVLNTAANEVQDVLQRLRTGAAINEREYAFYSNQLPKVTDTPERIAYKLRLFNDLFSAVAQGVNTQQGGF